MVRDEREDSDDDGNPDEVPPGADIGEKPDQIDAKSVEQSVGHQDDGVEQERVDRRRLDAPGQVGKGNPGQRRAEVDRRGHGDLTEEVEPPDIPGPNRLVPASQPTGPEVQTAGGRVDRACLLYTSPSP